MDLKSKQGNKDRVALTYGLVEVEQLLGGTVTVLSEVIHHVLRLQDDTGKVLELNNPAQGHRSAQDRIM